jgi:hypothetical protein
MDLSDLLVEREEKEFVWQDLAACDSMTGVRRPDGTVDDWFFDSYENSTVAEQVDEMCRRCPVRRNCLYAGVTNNEQGVWGGFYLTNGKMDKTRNAHKTEEEKEEFKSLLMQSM